MSTSFQPKAGIELPSGYNPRNLTNLEQFNGTLLVAANNEKDSGILIRSTKREVISDMSRYVANLMADQTKSLDAAKQTTSEQLTINGLKAWRFETSGKLKNLFGTEYTYLMTVLEGDKEVVTVNTWTNTTWYKQERNELAQLAFLIQGVQPPSQAVTPPAATAPTSIVASPPVTPTPSASNDALPTVTPTARTSSTESVQVENRSSPSVESAADRLRALGRLYKEGLITEKEFETKKAEILKSM